MHAKYRLQVESVLSRSALRVPDLRLETVKFYKVPGVKVAQPETASGGATPSHGCHAVRSIANRLDDLDRIERILLIPLG